MRSIDVNKKSIPRAEFRDTPALNEIERREDHLSIGDAIRPFIFTITFISGGIRTRTTSHYCSKFVAVKAKGGGHEPRHICEFSSGTEPGVSGGVRRVRSRSESPVAQLLTIAVRVRREGRIY